MTVMGCACQLLIKKMMMMMMMMMMTVYRLSDAVTAWWRCYPDCRIPVNMKLPVLAEEVRADVDGVKVISCSHGNVLLSCGLDNIDTAHADSDQHRYVVRGMEPTRSHCRAIVDSLPSRGHPANNR